MTVTLKKWGNSLAVRIPKDVARSLKVESDSLMELELQEGVLTLRPKRGNRLEALVSQIDEKNLHEEIETDGPVGNEAW